MRIYCSRTAATLLFSAALCMLSGTAAADGAFFIKGGVMRLQDDGQVINLTPRSLDDTSYSTLAFNWEVRKRNGVALGMEFLTYRNEFTPPAAQPGEAKTIALQFVGKKYFIDGGAFHPYVGGGIGAGRTNVSYNNGTSYSDEEFTLALQFLLGFELRFDNLSFVLEGKHLYHDIEGGGNEYNPTATGVFAGMGLNW
jgi:opacity protein-like surface antigen